MPRRRVMPNNAPSVYNPPIPLPVPISPPPPVEAPPVPTPVERDAARADFRMVDFLSVRAPFSAMRAFMACTLGLRATYGLPPVLNLEMGQNGIESWVPITKTIGSLSYTFHHVRAASTSFLVLPHNYSANMLEFMAQEYVDSPQTAGNILNYAKVIAEDIDAWVQATVSKSHRFLPIGVGNMGPVAQCLCEYPTIATQLAGDAWTFGSTRYCDGAYLQANQAGINRIYAVTSPFDDLRHFPCHPSRTQFRAELRGVFPPPTNQQWYDFCQAKRFFGRSVFSIQDPEEYQSLRRTYHNRMPQYLISNEGTFDTAILSHYANWYLIPLYLQIPSWDLPFIRDFARLNGVIGPWAVRIGTL